ncbi:hypothetical protein J3458_004661 [Metarhizium acridum]|uniref:uncharacterized protein n=1 Tax=Metarhizium acridum TaxID=92637 RepID=UPI001C6CF15B|nr:hypothetical protein J3458_004661 [Metarhizium acridum]
MPRSVCWRNPTVQMSRIRPPSATSRRFSAGEEDDDEAAKEAYRVDSSSPPGQSCRPMCPPPSWLGLPTAYIPPVPVLPSYFDSIYRVSAARQRSRDDNHSTELGPHTSQRQQPTVLVTIEAPASKQKLS